jgi:hypothetical protein
MYNNCKKGEGKKYKHIQNKQFQKDKGKNKQPVFPSLLGKIFKSSEQIFKQV